MAYDDFRSSDYNALDEEEFRALVRRFLAAHLPADLSHPIRRLRWNRVRPWYMILSTVGWLAPAWPCEYGGMGLEPAKLIVYVEEFEAAGAPRLPDLGVALLGPLLIQHGTDAQRARFLPEILSGGEIWCQGYSEPNAGSDLASLRTGAVRDGDDWIVNGQKVWTSFASDADWIFCLVRTDRTAKKQQGISFLLIPMDSPGITVRPIVNLELGDEFFEVFFDDVRVPVDNIVGEVNAGWTMAKNLLGFERIFLGSPRQASGALTKLLRIATRYRLIEDATFLDRYTAFRMELEDHTCLFSRVVDDLRRGRTLGAEVSFLKLSQTDLYQRITDYGLTLMGAEAGLLDAPDGDSDFAMNVQFLNARAATIYGGSSQVQKNVLAKSVLGLG